MSANWWDAYEEVEPPPAAAAPPAPAPAPKAAGGNWWEEYPTVDPAPAPQTKPPQVVTQPVSRVTTEPGFFSGLRDKTSQFLGDQVDAFRNRYNNAEVATSQYIGDYIDEVAAARARRQAVQGDSLDLGDGLTRLGGQAEALAQLGSQFISIPASLALTNRPDEVGLDPSAEFRQYRERTSYAPRSEYGAALGEEFGAYLKPVGDLFSLVGKGAGELGEAFGASPETSEYLRTITPDIAGSALSRPPPNFAAARIPEPVRVPRVEPPPVEAVPPPAPPARAPLEGAQRARAAGYVVTPTEAGGGFIPRRVEGLTGSAKLARDASIRNQANTNKLVAEEIGLPAGTKLTDAALDNAAKPHSAVYAEVAETAGTFQASPEYFADLQAAIPERGLTREAEANVRKLISEYSTEAFDAPRAVQDMRQLRYEASRAMRSDNPDMAAFGQAKRAVSDAIEAELERRAVAVGEPDLLDRFREARRSLAKINTVRDARVGSDVSAKNLAKLAKRYPLDGRLKIIADTYGDFPTLMRNPSTMGDKTAVNMTDAAMGAIGFGAGNMLSAVAAATVRPAARSALMSDMYQNTYGRPAEPLGPDSPLGEYFRPAARPRSRSGPITPPGQGPVPAAAPAAPASATPPADVPLGDVLPPTPAGPRPAPPLPPVREPPRPVTEPADMSPTGNAAREPPYTPPADAVPAGPGLADELLDYGRVIDNELLIEATRRNGGVTYQPITGHSPEPYKPGAYMVSPYPERSVILDPGALSLDAVDDFLLKNADLLANTDHYFGAWHDTEKTGKVFLDVSIIETTVEKAIETGLNKQQIAYFSFEDMKSHDIDPAMRERWVPPDERAQADQGNSAGNASAANRNAGPRGDDLGGDNQDIRANGGPRRDSGGTGGASRETPQARSDGLGDELTAPPKKTRRQRPPKPTLPTDTPEFKRWFGNSKAVDKNGKPLVLYHGTRQDFTAFDKGKLGAATEAASASKGFFFSNRPQTAESYTNIVLPDEKAAHDALFDEGTKLRKSAFRSRSPDPKKRAERMNRLAREGDELLQQASEMRRQGGNVMPVYLSMKNPLVYDMKGKRYRDQSYSDIIERAISEGRDGVIIKNTYDAVLGDGIADDVYVIFDPKQVKSAIGNSGKFDPDVDDITGSTDSKRRKRSLGDELLGDEPDKLA